METETAQGPVPDVDVYTYIFKDIHIYGDQVALTDTCTGRSLTYNQFVHNVEAVSCGLKNLGVTRSSVIAIFSSNSIPFVVIFFAAQRLGAIITTVNHTYTSRELNYQLNNSEAEWVCNPESMLRTTEGAIHANTHIKGIILTDLMSHPTHVTYNRLCESPRVTLPHPLFNPRKDVAVIPYSSGTTGLAKGVMITHRNILAAIMIIDDLPLGSSALLYLPMYHIYGMVYLMARVLARKRHLLVMPKFTPHQFCSTIEKHQVSSLFIVPPTAVFLAKSPIPRKYNLSCVKNILCGSAPLGAETEHTLQKLYGITPSQIWGMTETTGVGTGVLKGVQVQSGSIGRTYIGTEIQIVDPVTNKICNTNEIGELWYRSVLTMKGYLNNPEATRSTITEDGWLKTGDVGYINENGDVFVKERLKELIKYKGFQVAPAELEQLLLGHPEVLDAAVIGVVHSDSGEVPIAFIVKDSNSNITAHELQQYVKAQTAPHKWLRGGIEFIQSIPKSASGKILRRELRHKETKSKL